MRIFESGPYTPTPQETAVNEFLKRHGRPRLRSGNDDANANRRPLNQREASSFGPKVANLIEFYQLFRAHCWKNPNWFLEELLKLGVKIDVQKEKNNQNLLSDIGEAWRQGNELKAQQLIESLFLGHDFDTLHRTCLKLKYCTNKHGYVHEAVSILRKKGYPRKLTNDAAELHTFYESLAKRACRMGLMEKVIEYTCYLSMEKQLLVFNLAAEQALLEGNAAAMKMHIQTIEGLLRQQPASLSSYAYTKRDEYIEEKLNRLYHRLFLDSVCEAQNHLLAKWLYVRMSEEDQYRCFNLFLNNAALSGDFELVGPVCEYLLGKPVNSSQLPKITAFVLNILQSNKHHEMNAATLYPGYNPALVSDMVGKAAEGGHIEKAEALALRSKNMQILSSFVQGAASAKKYDVVKFHVLSESAINFSSAQLNAVVLSVCWSGNPELGEQIAIMAVNKAGFVMPTLMAPFSGQPHEAAEVLSYMKKGLQRLKEDGDDVQLNIKISEKFKITPFYSLADKAIDTGKIQLALNQIPHLIGCDCLAHIYFRISRYFSNATMETHDLSTLKIAIEMSKLSEKLGA